MFDYLVTVIFLASFLLGAGAQVQTRVGSDCQAECLATLAPTKVGLRSQSQRDAANAERYRTLTQQQTLAYCNAVEHPIPGGKFPTAADTARRLKEFYEHEAGTQGQKGLLCSGEVRVPKGSVVDVARP